MNEDQIQFLKPFGPSIIKAKIPSTTLETLNKYIDEVVKNKKKIERSRSW